MATKYPVVLVHGIMVKELKFFKAFGRIEHILAAANHSVTTAQSDGFGSIETNAEQLKEHIEKVLRETGAEKVNLIAHSKGGLDSRYMIANLGMADKVASLTCLCTPHQGSRIATRLYALPTVIKYPIAGFLHLLFRIFGDKKPEVLKVCKQLSYVPEGVPEVAGAHLPEGIFVQSYSSTMSRGSDDFIMAIPHLFSREVEKEPDTDGVVSRESAMFGEFRGDCTDGSISHIQMVDFTMRRDKKAKVYLFYLDICYNLAKRGY